MRKTFARILLAVSLVTAPVLGTGMIALAEEQAYETVIIDEQDLLTDEEEQKLLPYMKQNAVYGNVIFATTSLTEDKDSLQNAKDKYYEMFGNEPGVYFQIDMGNREISLACSTDMEKTLGKERHSIVDNCYRYASNADYFNCARECFEEIYTVQNEGRIAHTMKYTNNAILALLLGLLVNYFVVFSRGKPKLEGHNRKKTIVPMSVRNLVVTPGETIERPHKEISHARSSGYSGGGSSYGSGGGSSHSSGRSSHSSGHSSHSSGHHSGGGGGFRGGGSSHKF